MAVKVYLDEYKGWKNCVYITNGDAELVVTTEIGPRVLSYRLCDGENVFNNDEKLLGKTGGDKWVNYGGHRLWFSPEDKVRSYHADNFPIKYELKNNGVKVTLEEPENGVLKTMEFTLADKGSEVCAYHTITNTGRWPVEFAAWGISVMKKGGFLVVPVVKGDENDLLPNHTFTFWPYDKYDDKRFHMGKKAITLRQDVNGDGKFKFGLPNESCVAGYFVDNTLFLKRHEHDKDAYYPDFNCSFESYTDTEILEVESISPLFSVNMGETIDHEEHWSLHKLEKTPSIDDEDALLDVMRKNI